MDPEFANDINMDQLPVDLTPDEVVTMVTDLENTSIQSQEVDKMEEDSTVESGREQRLPTTTPKEIDQMDADMDEAPETERRARTPTPAPLPVTNDSPAPTRSASTSTGVEIPSSKNHQGVVPTQPPSLPNHNQAQPPQVSDHSVPITASMSTTPADGYRPPKTRLTLPTSQPPQHTPAQMAAAFVESRKLMAKMMAENQGIPVASIPHSNTNGEGSSGSTRPSSSFGMHNEDDDQHWMHEEAEEDDREVYLNEIFAKLNEQKKRVGRLSSEDEMELYRASQQLLTLNRLKNGRLGNHVCQDEIQEDSLFIPESNHERRDTVANRHRQRQAQSPQDHDMTDDSNDDDLQFQRPPGNETNDDTNLRQMLQQVVDNGEIDSINQPEPVRGLKKNGQPRKRRAPVAKTAREVKAQKEAKVQENAAKKIRGKRGKEKDVVAAKPKAKGKAKAKKGKESTKERVKNIKNGESLLRSGPSNWRRSGADIIGNHILQSLVVNDDIDARLNNPIYNVDEEPEIEGRQTKDNQFRTLFSSIPIGTNKAGVREDKRQLKQAAKAFGHGKVKADRGKWTLMGMNTPLYHHQLIGARWMVERELSQQAPYGGILADSMGLGKTIQTLAAMIGNPPMEADVQRKVKATLIVCPATLVQQWIEEIEKHAGKKTFPKVIRYKAAAGLTREVLQDLDIVVTSYHEIMKTFPFPNKADREEITANGYDKWWERVRDTIGVVHQVNWYRVVLDEAHNIKNNTARTSLACQNLHSVYRWCLTGTPLMNRFEELFPYLRFLKADYTMDWQTFQKYFCDPQASDCILRVNTLLSCCMFRRTMSSTILGRPIIKLPTPHPTIEFVNFSPAEKIIYRITENRFRANLNKFFERGDAARNYSVFMVQLLRLRQITSHPWMIEGTIRECWTLEDLKELKKRLKELDEQRRGPFYEQTQIWLKETEAERDAVVARGEVPMESIAFGKGTFGRSFKMTHVLATLSEQEMADRMTCGKCFDCPRPPVQTNECQHIFCRECIEGEIHYQAQQNDEAQSVFICPTCENMFNGLTPVKIKPGQHNDFVDEDIDGSDDGRRKKLKIAADSKGVDMMGFEPHSESTWIPKSDSDPDFDFTPSVKTGKLKALLLKGFHEAPLDKVVVYVQFRTLARIVARICHSESWGFLYFTGDTSQEHRQNAIKKFKEDSDVKILIAGLKCGGIGLNFPWANRVISLDLWWNHAIEQQAFGRIFRIGQEKETYMTRIVVKQSVDMRLLSMQGHKLKAISQAIRDDDKTNDRPNLSLKQLANLFGFLRTDEDDNIISVEPDYDDMEEWKAGGAGRDDGPFEWENVAVST